MCIGRPLKFRTVKELQDKIDAFFRKCDIENRPYTITGLALALNVTRETLVEYENNKKKPFSDTVKKAKLKCQRYAEECLYRNQQVAGPIFNLKNNYGWREKQEIDHTTDGRPFVLPSEVLEKHGFNTSAKKDSNR